MSSTPQGDPAEVRVRWGVMAAVTIAGMGVTAAPFLLSWLVDHEFGEWRPLLSTTLTSAGTVILLVAAIWFLERKFSARVRAEVREVARETAERETQKLATSHRDLSLRLDELQKRMDRRATQERSEQDKIIQRLSEEASFESVYGALALADDIGALWSHQIVIPTGDGDPGEPRFVFRRSAASSTRPLHRLREDETSRRSVVEIEYQAESERAGVTAFWEAASPADEVLHALRQQMIGVGAAAHSACVDVSLLANLHSALREAVASRRGDEGAWLKGSVSEWISDVWVITSYGLEHRGSLGMRSEEFPVHWDGRSNQASWSWKPPAAPEGVDGTMWDFLIARARRYHRSGASLRV